MWKWMCLIFIVMRRIGVATAGSEELQRREEKKDADPLEKTFARNGWCEMETAVARTRALGEEEKQPGKRTQEPGREPANTV